MALASKHLKDRLFKVLALTLITVALDLALAFVSEALDLALALRLGSYT